MNTSVAPYNGFNLKFTKIISIQGSASDPGRGAYCDLPDPLAGFGGNRTLAHTNLCIIIITKNSSNVSDLYCNICVLFLF